MKAAVYRLFDDRRRAEGTVRELVLMQIPERDITVSAVRSAERRSFTSSDRPPDSQQAALMVRANVDQEDVQRVEATLVRNGGVEGHLPTQPLTSFAQSTR